MTHKPQPYSPIDPAYRILESKAKARKASADMRKKAEVYGIVPVRNSTMPSSENVAPWLKAPSTRPGADDFLNVPTLRPDGRYYRDGRVKAL